jgi:hypothetical protein
METTGQLNRYYMQKIYHGWMYFEDFANADEVRGLTT